MQVLEQKVGGHWAKSDSERLFRIIFDDDSEADFVFDKPKTCISFDQNNKIQDLYDYFKKRLIKSDSFHDGKPSVVIYSNKVPQLITCFAIFTIKLAAHIEGYQKLKSTKQRQTPDS